MTPKKLNVAKKLIPGALSLLILALGFNAMLSLSLIEKLYVESKVSQYRLMGKYLKRDIEKALSFGKNIEKFIGMSKRLSDTRKNLIKNFTETGSDQTPDMYASVSIAMPSGLILYSTDEKLKNTMLPEGVGLNSGNNSEDEASHTLHVKIRGVYHITLPIIGFGKERAGAIIIAFHEKPIKELSKTVFKKSFKLIAIIITCGFILLLLMFRFVIPQKQDAMTTSKSKIYFTMFTVIILSQIVFTSINTLTFENHYIKITGEKARDIGAILKRNINYLLSKGLRLNNLAKMEVMLGELIEIAPELEYIIITDARGDYLYASRKDVSFSFQTLPHGTLKDHMKKDVVFTADPEYKILIKIMSARKHEGGTVRKNNLGNIIIGISPKALSEKLKATILDSATVLAVSIFFFIEMLILIFQFMGRGVGGASEKPLRYKAIRPAAFIFLFGFDISVAFLPLHAEKLYTPLSGLSKNMVIGLPISAQMLFTGVSILIAGAWLDRRGWYQPFIAGIVIACIGSLYSWLAPDIIHFIASRSFIGLGYGLAWMACQGFVIAYSDSKTKNYGMSQLIAGIMAGSICGSASGAMLAERAGYQTVFLVGAVILLSSAVYALIFMRDFIKKPLAAADLYREKTGSVNAANLFKFIFDKRVSGLILCCAIPGAITAVGFIDYFCPVYLKQSGASPSDIGRIIMLHGICLIYLSPVINKYIDGSSKKKIYIAVEGVIAGAGFMIFYMFSGILASFLTVLMIGVSNCFNSVQRSYLLRLKAVKEIGSGKAMGIFNSATRLGQVAGPVLFGLLLTSTRLNRNIAWFGIVYIVMVLIFMILVRHDKKKQ